MGFSNKGHRHRHATLRREAGRQRPPWGGGKGGERRMITGLRNGLTDPAGAQRAS